MFRKTKTFFIRVLCVFGLLSVLAALGIEGYSFYAHETLNTAKLKNFEIYQDLQLVKNAQTITSLKFKQKPLKEMVLLLHSFSTSPEDFKKILKILDKKGIAYHAPRILGFGLTDTDLLESIEGEDWVRNVVEQYDMCESLADKVHVVGQSFGANLATILASRRKVEKLVLLSPILFFKGDALRLQQKAERPAIKFFAEKVLRYIDLHPESRSIFRYESLPIRSLLALTRIQEMAKQSLSRSRGSKVYVLYGQFDQIANYEQTFEHFTSKGFAHESHAYRAPHSLFIESSDCQGIILKKIEEIFS